MISDEPCAEDQPATREAAGQARATLTEPGGESEPYVDDCRRSDRVELHVHFMGLGAVTHSQGCVLEPAGRQPDQAGASPWALAVAEVALAAGGQPV